MNKMYWKGRIRKMKKIFKKVIATVAAFAFAAAGLVVAPKTAKAAETEKEFVVVLSDETDIDNVYLDVNVEGGVVQKSPDFTFTSSATETSDMGWGRDMYAFTKSSSNPRVWTIKISSDDITGKYCNFQVLAVSGTNNLKASFKYYPQNHADMFNAGGKMYFSMDTTATWVEVAPSSTDPLAITAEEVIEKINAIGTVKFPESVEAVNKAKTAIDSFTGNKADITNMDVYTAAVAKLAELKEASKGKVTIFVKDEAEWGKVGVHAWSGSTPFSTWPGKIATAVDGYNGWYAVEFDLTEVPASIKLTNGVSGGKESNELANLVKGTYWVTVDAHNVATLSTEAPEGAPTSIVTPGGGDNTPAGGDNTPAGGDNTPAGGDNTPAGGNNGNVNAGDSMAVATAIIAAVAACGIVVVSFKKRRQDA